MNTKKYLYRGKIYCNNVVSNGKYYYGGDLEDLAELLAEDNTSDLETETVTYYVLDGKYYNVYNDGVADTVIEKYVDLGFAGVKEING